MKSLTPRQTIDKEPSVEGLSKDRTFEHESCLRCGSKFEEESNNNQPLDDTDSDSAAEESGRGNPSTSVVKSAPGIPSYISKDANSLTFQWEPAPSHGDVTSPTYEVLMQQADVAPGSLTPNSRTARTLVEANAWIDVYTGKECWTQIKGLMPGGYYAVKIRCCCTDNAWNSDYSPIVVLHTTPTIPSVPQPPELLSLEPTAMTLKWNPPTQQGGSEIHAYRLQLKPIPTQRSTEFDDVYLGPDTSIHIVSLLPSTKYTARVMAINEVGESRWSLPSCFTTKPAQPNVPQALRVSTTSSCSIKLEWSSKWQNGRDRDQYEIEVENVEQKFRGIEHIGEALDCEIDGLELGHLYRFRVRAYNSCGSSEWSPSVECSTAPCVPTPPLHLSVPETTAEGTAIAWNPPHFSGSLKPLQFQAEVILLLSDHIKEEGGMKGTHSSPNALAEYQQTWHVVYQGHDCSCFLRGLKPGRRYCARVRALNEAGTGLPSLPVSFWTVPALPEQPGTPYSVKSLDRIMRIAWTPPSHDGGSTVHTYILQQSTVTDAEQDALSFVVVYQGCQNSVEMSELECGVVYAFRVCAVNAVGQSSWSDVSHENIVPVSPLFPTNLRAVQNDSATAHLHWDSSRHDCISPSQTTYLVAMAIQDTAVESAPEFRIVYRDDSTHCMVSDLAANTIYLFKAKTINKQGKESGWSPPLVIQTPSALPTTPTQLELYKVTCTEIEVEWSPSRSSSSASDIWYIAEVKLDGYWAERYHGRESSCSIDGLSAGRDYAVRVRAMNAEGESPQSTPLEVVTDSAVPSSPDVPYIAQITSTSLRIRWTAPEANGKVVEGYKVEVEGDDGSLYEVPVHGGETFLKIADLAPRTPHRLRLAACNAVGWSLWSLPAMCVTKFPLPPMPTQVKGTGVESRIEVSWSMEKEKTEGETTYEIEAFVAGGKKSKNSQTPVSKMKSVEMFCALSGIEPGQKYEIRIRAVSSTGVFGKWSESVTVRLADSPARSRGHVPDTLHEVLTPTIDSGGTFVTRRPRKGQVAVPAKKKHPLKKRKSFLKIMSTYSTVFIVFALLLFFLVMIIHG